MVPARVATVGKLRQIERFLSSRWPAQLVGEELLAEGDRLVLVGRVEPGAPPRLLGALDDERRGRLRRSGTRAPGRGRASFSLKRNVNASNGNVVPEPDEPVRPQVDARLELRGVAARAPAVDAVGGDAPGRRPRQRGEVGHLGLEARASTPSAARALAAGCRAARWRASPQKPWPRRGQDLAPEVDVDVVPVREAPGDLGVGLRIGLARGCRASRRRRRRRSRTCRRAGCARRR